MLNENKLKLNLINYEYVKDYFNEKKLLNIVLFSQARSGSTFVTNNLSKYLGFQDEEIYPEDYFIGKHFSYLNSFVKKHKNFFLNTNEFVYKRPLLNNKNTLFLYLYRDSEKISASYEKAKKLNYYHGWSEFYSKYKKLYPNIDQNLHVTMFNHCIWEEQIKYFDHALTLDFKSFENFDTFITDTSVIKNIKQISKNEDRIKINLQNKINFNLFEKIYFNLRRKFESRKKTIKNY